MAAIVKGGFWEVNGVMLLTTAHTTSAGRRRISQMLARKQLMGLREVMETLNGVAPGSAANKQYTRVAPSMELGGPRAIETEFLVSRATTTADRDDILADLLTLSTKTYDSTPVSNKDGNPLGTR